MLESSDPCCLAESETFLLLNADYLWTTDYYVTSDLRLMKQWKPLYKTFNSTVEPVANERVVVRTPRSPPHLQALPLLFMSCCGSQGQENKGQAMEIGDRNGWVMLGLNDTQGVFTSDTGREFAGTCLSDPEQCTEGLSVALWLKICELVHRVS